MAVASAATAAVNVKPAPPEQNEAARVALEKAFNSQAALEKSSIATDVVSVGPRLWAATKDVRMKFPDSTKDGYSMLPSRWIVTKWKLTPVDLVTVKDETERAVLEQMLRESKEGTVVQQGRIVDHSTKILAALVKSRVDPGEFPFKIRKPTADELTYYYAIIPFEIEEPIWVIDSGSHAFLCHFFKGQVFYFEAL